ncbi:BF3164 family lipoprotein [Phocaeicola sp.]
MKKHKNVLLLFLIVLCSSCYEKQVEIDSFDDVEEIITYDSIYTDKAEPFGTITDMKIFNNILILEHMNDDFQYSFIDVIKKQILCRWGKIGEGPNEFIDFGSGFFIQDSCLMFSTFAKKEINYVPLKDILNNESSINIRKEKFPYNVDFRPRKICPVGDLKMTVGSFEHGLFGVLDSENKIMEANFDFPFLYDEVQGIYKGSVFQSLVSSNGKNKFVISILSSDIFQIFEILDSGIHKTYTSPFRHIPQIWEKGGRYTIDYEKSIAGLMKMATSEKNICFTYSTQSYADASRIGKVSKEILSFDWTGKKVKKYILPFAVSSICLDNNYIYGIRCLGDETIIYRFKL